MVSQVYTSSMTRLNKDDGFQHLYWPGIKESIYREVTFCDTCQRTKRSIIKYGKLPEKLAEETTWNKLDVDLIGA